MNELLFSYHSRRSLRKGFFKRIIWTAAGSCALGGLYAWRPEEHWLRIERRPMVLPNLGAGFEGARVAHISDLHCSPIVLERYLLHAVDAVNALEPDYVVMTGDFITGPRHYARRVARVLRHLEPKVASLACLGNHDYGVFHPTGLGAMRNLADYLTDQLAHADIFVLNNEPRTFRSNGDALQFVGVEDLWSGRFDPDHAFEHVDESLPTIGLVHNPDAGPTMASYGAHWVLSGHTHGSSVENNPVMPAENGHFAAGEYELEGGSRLYVNRGIGYGRRVLLNSRPEITLFTLQSA
jgi:predicted MPP superfamily phosphohydrolase